jgi:UPF0755 protein
MRAWTRKFLGLSIILLSFVLGWQIFDYRDFTRSALQVPEGGQRITIPVGSSLKSIARDLAKNSMIEKPRWLEWMGRLQGKANRIQAGEYHIEKGTSAQQFLDMLVNGKVVQYSFTLIEGWNVKQMLDALKKTPHVEQTLGNESAATIMEALSLNGWSHGEGWFMPDTYFFIRGTSDREILRRSHVAMFNFAAQAWDNRAEGLPYKDILEVLTMASIIEKETGVPFERREIAGVFVRRLQKNMKLQTDPTVIYGIGDKYDGNIRRRDLRTDTPYNTYTRKGLPPTPIAMPGRAAIEAALQPAEGTSLYFVAKGDGSHAFATTLDEHNQNVIKYQLKGRKRPFSSYPAKSKKSGT